MANKFTPIILVFIECFLKKYYSFLLYDFASYKLLKDNIIIAIRK